MADRETREAARKTRVADRKAAAAKRVADRKAAVAKRVADRKAAAAKKKAERAAKKKEGGGFFDQLFRTGKSSPKVSTGPSQLGDSAGRGVNRRNARSNATPESPSSNNPVAIARTKGGDFPQYVKNAPKAESFRGAFASARKAGKDTFTWDGRKYTTEVAKKAGGKVKKMNSGGAVKKMNVGGKIRGAGIAQRGVRPAKMM
jgi:hypothetical protein